MVRITKENISECRSNYQPGITTIAWYDGPLDEQVLRTFPDLQKIICVNGKLKSLTALRGCPQLKFLHCFFNLLETLKGIEHCPQLVELQCSGNLLKTLIDLRACPLLQTLDCDNNRLASLIGLENCTQLQTLRCTTGMYRPMSYRSWIQASRVPQVDLVSLKGIENCIQLRSLDCSNRPVSLEILVNFPHIETINCHSCELTSLQALSTCVKLKVINCSYNRLGSLKELAGCVELESIQCSQTMLASLEGIENWPRLQSFTCRQNGLTRLTGIERCLELRYLDCCENNLTTLTDIEACMQLETVVVHHNKLQSLAPLVYLPRLRHISFHNNPLDVQSIQVQRLLARNEAKNASSVYADGQNVHNAHIQKTVCESIQRLLTDPKPVFSIEDITKAGLDVIATELLLIYCADTCVHSAHLLTYAELLGYVWARICRSEHKVELFKILGEQVCESKDLCLTGRFNRTVSVLMGFYDDIMICISDSSRITAIVLAARAKIEVYDPTQHLELATKLLTEAGYGADMIEPWLRAISEP